MSALTNRIVRYFPNSDLRLGHPGLTKRAIAEDVDLNAVGVGEFLLFVNRAQTSFKMLTQGKVLVHFRGSKRLNPATFALIPKYFNGRAVDYDRALVEALRRDFKMRNIPAPTNRIFAELRV